MRVFLVPRKGESWHGDPQISVHLRDTRLVGGRRGQFRISEPAAGKASTANCLVRGFGSPPGYWVRNGPHPNRFENKCAGNVVVYYELNEEGKVNLRNQYRLQKGSMDTGQGCGSVVDTVSKAKLRVTFFWPFHADYWIIDPDKDYRYAVVGGPGRKYLWIISLTPQLDAETYQ
jgi:hypothetical protein